VFKGQGKGHNDTQHIDTKYNNKNATLRVHHANISNTIDSTDVDVIKLHFLQVGLILET
jgi:hypothetical protein